jgi:hypothetical protein
MNHAELAIGSGYRFPEYGGQDLCRWTTANIDNALIEKGETAKNALSFTQAAT